ncbi:madf domain transcription factor [Holotrichia oblita]|uniref:Madf domain transcription factor n=1 Tax=Holotrichia oblita TaxID=644536 RepID=A0ACB9SLZ2_HOLOL|nr:madf domain transcription factor [Holotrichia oblita]
MLSQNKGKRLRFSVEEDEKLINTVQKHPALYDASNKIYKNQNVRDNAWDDVAGVVGRCENKQGTGSQAIHVSKWEHMDALSFLENVQTSRKHITNCSIEIIETEDLGESPTCSPSQPDIVEEVVQDTPTEDSVRRNTATNKKRKISNENIVEILNKRAEERTKLLKTIGEASVKPRNHPIKTFFESMAETVMTFPTFLAVQAKQEVLRVISELELQACETTLNNRNFSSTSTYTTPTVSRTPVDDSATNSTYAELSSVEPRTYEDCADLLSNVNI